MSQLSTFSFVVLLLIFIESINGQDCPTAAKCKTCTAGACATCFAGLGLTANTPATCDFCASGCLDCAKVAERCLKCETLPGKATGPSPTGGTCTDCSPDCFICEVNGAGKCDRCKPTFGVDSTQKCIPCMAHCESCTTSTTCDICVKYYDIVGGVCVECAKNCTGCKTNGAGKCDDGKCDPGFQLNAEKICEMPSASTMAMSMAAMSSPQGPTGGGGAGTSGGAGGPGGSSGPMGGPGEPGGPGGPGGPTVAGPGQPGGPGGPGGPTAAPGQPGGPGGPGGPTTSGGGGLSGDQVIGVTLGTVFGVAGLLASLLMCFYCCPGTMGSRLSPMAAQQPQYAPQPYTQPPSQSTYMYGPGFQPAQQRQQSAEANFAFRYVSS